MRNQTQRGKGNTVKSQGQLIVILVFFQVTQASINIQIAQIAQRYFTKALEINQAH